MQDQLQQQLPDIFHGVKSITLEQVQLLQYYVLLAHQDSPLTPLVPQPHPQLVNSVFHAQQSQLHAHKSEFGLDITSIHLPAFGLLVQQMLPHVCIHHQVSSQHLVQQDIIYNNN
jgi:hypothetical protein